MYSTPAKLTDELPALRESAKIDVGLLKQYLSVLNSKRLSNGQNPLRTGTVVCTATIIGSVGALAFYHSSAGGVPFMLIKLPSDVLNEWLARMGSVGTNAVLNSYFTYFPLEELIDRVFKEPISSIMTTTVLTIDPDASVVQFAQTLKDYDIGALPVLKNNELLGLITENDIVRTIALPSKKNRCSSLIVEASTMVSGTPVNKKKVFRFKKTREVVL